MPRITREDIIRARDLLERNEAVAIPQPEAARTGRWRAQAEWVFRDWLAQDVVQSQPQEEDTMADPKSCKRCGVTDDTVKTYGGDGAHCDKCKEKYLIICNVCKKRRSKCYDISDGTVICHECASKTLHKQCNLCGKHHTTFVRGEQLVAYGTAFKDDKWPALFSRVCAVCVEKIRATPKTNRQRCGECGDYYALITLSGGSTYCRHCLDRFHLCADCGTFESHEFIVEGDKRVCRNCSRNYKRCPACRTYHQNPASVCCTECAKTFTQCSYCRGIRELRKMRRLPAKYHRDGVADCCSGCYSEIVKVCEECEADGAIVTSKGRRVCHDCRFKKGIPHLERHDFRPNKFNKYGKGLMLGLEHEIAHSSEEHADKTLEYMAKHYHNDDVYCQHDGSVKNGVEVVAHPRTLAWIKENELWVKNLFPNIMTAPLFIKHPSAGMHVHIDRKGFVDKKHLLRFMVFMSINRGFIEFIAGRKGGGERQWKFTPAHVLKEKCEGIDPADKYVDVNIKHEETIEVRIFAGAVTPEQMLKNLEFIDALVNYSKDYKLRDMYLVNRFVEFAHTKAEYKNLQIFTPNSIDYDKKYEKSYKEKRGKAGTFKVGDMIQINTRTNEHGQGDVALGQLGMVSHIEQDGRLLRLRISGYHNYMINAADVIRPTNNGGL